MLSARLDILDPPLRMVLRCVVFDDDRAELGRYPCRGPQPWERSNPFCGPKLTMLLISTD